MSVLGVSGMLIRTAGTGDLVALTKLERSIENAPHWSEVSWREALEEVAVASGGLRRTVLVAEIDGGLAGFLVLQLIVGLVEIESLAVSPPHRRKGIAKALCLAGIGWARLQAAGMMELEVRASNAAAIALYLALGFREQGRRLGYYREPAEDAVLMSQEL